MKCKTVRTKIALCAGNDLDPSGKRELKSHLSACEPCRTYWREMKSSLQVLHEPAVAQDDAAFNSLWPKIASRLPKRARMSKQNRFNGWAAAASVTAACIVLVAFAVTYNPPLAHNDYAVPSGMFPATAVDFPAQDRGAADRGSGRFEEDLFSPTPDSRRSRNEELERYWQNYRR